MLGFIFSLLFKFSYDNLLV